MASPARVPDSPATSSNFLDTLNVVLLHADWTARSSAPCVCKAWRNALLVGDGEPYWQWLCERLRDECKLYVPAGLCPNSNGWKAHFAMLWRKRDLWKHKELPADGALATPPLEAELEAEEGSTDEAEALWRLERAREAAAAAKKLKDAETFSVSVCARFRPAVATAGGTDANNEGDVVVIPLHQRVSMVRAKHGCSQAKAMRIVMQQEAAAKAKARGGTAGSAAGVEACVMEDCVVAVGERPSESALAALEAKQAAAAEAHNRIMEAEAPWMAERARRKPHMGLGRAPPGRRQGVHNEADEAMDVVAGAAVAAQAAVPANRIEAALFDRADSEAPAAQAPMEAGTQASLWNSTIIAEAPASTTGIVQLTCIPAGTSEEQILAFFAQLAGDQTPRPPASHRPVYLLGPPEGASARALVEAFVVFDSCEAADRACMLSHNRKLNGRLPEIFRATQEHMQHVLGEAEARAKAAREAAREASRLATIEAARAARAAEKERHRQDALALAASKEAAAKEAREKRAPYALVGGGKENEAEGGAGNSGGAVKGKGDEASVEGPDASGAGSDTRAAIISVSEERAEVLTMAPGCGLRPFAFERVFDVQQSQESVYELCGRGAVADFLNGHSACVLVYGQTGAGKTHTMFGDGTADPRLGRAASRRGLVPRVCEELIGAVEHRRTLGIDATVSVAYVEVFGNEVTDLLREGAQIGASDGGADNHFHAHRWVLSGRADVPIDSVESALGLIAQGDSCKRKAATAMNERSSRAHALFILSLTQTCDGVERISRLFLADLGGSEKLSKSGAADDFRSLVISSGGEEISRITWAEYYQHRQRLQESLNINVGLFALQRCIEKLISRDELRAQGKPCHVPFADSKLTLLLKDALNGGARTTVLVCASLEPRNAVESIQSLRFGESCSRVEMRGRGAGDGAAALKRLVEDLDRQIAEQQAIIVRDQRWERRVTTRYDVVDFKENFVATKTTDLGDSEVNLGDVAAGVVQVDLDLASLDKGGMSRFSLAELRDALEKRSLDTSGDRAALFGRLRAAVAADDSAAKTTQQTIAHEVVANVLVGAEEAEAKLDALLQRKRELLGEI